VNTDTATNDTATNDTATTNTATTDPTPAGSTACYVYGVVPATAPAPPGVLGVGTPPAPVELVRHGRIAALVSAVDPGEPLGTPDDLRAHARVLDALVANATPVLPFQFGGVVSDRQAVADDLLEPGEPGLVAALAELGDLVQFTVRGTYRQDQMLREILRDRSDIAALREHTKDLPAEAGMDHQMRLGEMISQELAARRQADSQALLDALAPFAAASVDAAPDDEQALGASFLVHPDEREDFDAGAEDLAGAWAERIDLRLLGPLAPYDFAAALVEHTERTQ
jgi:hypothetical protein